jgi:hypothetical protein
MQHLLTRENILIAVKELLWLGITALVTAAALYPVTQKDSLYLLQHLFCLYLHYAHLFPVDHQR